MGRTWELINVDRKERNLAGGWKIMEFFWTRGEMTYLYRALQTPCLPDDVDEWLSRGSVAVQPGSIGKLPTEVIDMLFQAILYNNAHSSTTNLLSCICLSITCKWLLSVGKRHILEALIEHYPRAVGCRIVCLGEYTDVEDQAPPGMLTEEELKEIAETELPYEDDRNEEGADPNLLPERYLYNFAIENYRNARTAWRKREGALMRERFTLWKKHNPRRPRDKHRDPQSEFDDWMIDVLADSWATYLAGPNVLLNLSKGECVREATLVVLGGDPYNATLAHAVLSRVCYSKDPSVADEFCGEEFVGRFGRGPWAGDRFCIVREDDMPVPEEGWAFTEWRDVTEEVNRLLGNLWRAMDCEGQFAERAQVERSKDAVYEGAQRTS